MSRAAFRRALAHNFIACFLRIPSGTPGRPVRAERRLAILARYSGSCHCLLALSTRAASGGLPLLLRGLVFLGTFGRISDLSEYPAFHYLLLIRQV